MNNSKTKKNKQWFTSEDIGLTFDNNNVYFGRSYVETLLKLISVAKIVVEAIKRLMDSVVISWRWSFEITSAATCFFSELTSSSPRHK